jgi:hypothetical protein
MLPTLTMTHALGVLKCPVRDVARSLIHRQMSAA